MTTYEIIENSEYNSREVYNSMVNYFNTNFYYDLHTKPGKSWAA